MFFTNYRVLLSALLFVLALTACSPASPEAPYPPDKLQVLATTTIIGDVVANIGAEAIDLTVLLPAGSDPHAYEPTPQDIASIADADVIFANGAGLEAFLDDLIANAGGQAQVVYLADGIDLLDASTDQHTDENGHHNEADPHVWTDPNNVLVWVASIQNTLGELDPDNAAIYQANADQYGQELQQLDAWIREQVAQIPTENREIITDHLVFGYFADEYGFTQVGAILPGYSTLAEPSAQELAQTEDAIRNLGVKALFVGETVNSQVAKQVALDTGLQLVFLNTGSLSEEGGQADSYLDYIRYNVEAIVNALK